MTAYNSINSSMVGIGISPEGINQNYFLYEMMLDIGYQLQSIDVNKWMENFVERRSVLLSIISFELKYKQTLRLRL